MRLRWLALLSVSASASLAVLGLVQGLNLMVISAAVLTGMQVMFTFNGGLPPRQYSH